LVYKDTNGYWVLSLTLLTYYVKHGFISDYKEASN
jgi:hypothetical protein